MVPIIRRHVRVPAVGAGFVALAVAGILLTDPVSPEKARLAAPTAQAPSDRLTADAGLGTGVPEGARASRHGAAGGWKLLAV